MAVLIHTASINMILICISLRDAAEQWHINRWLKRAKGTVCRTFAKNRLNSSHKPIYSAAREEGKNGALVHGSGNGGKELAA